MKLTYTLFTVLICISNTFGQTILDKLPELKVFTTNYMFSSCDPEGGNSDGFEGGNYLYSTKRGSVNIDSPLPADSSELEYVMVDIRGAGILKRFWNARYNITDTVRFYIDGSPSPEIEMTIKEIFYDKLSPFDNDFTYDYSQNTGALLTYTPIYFETSLIATINNPIGYYHFNIELLGKEYPDEQDKINYVSELNTLLDHAGERPNSLNTATWDSLTISLAPGEESLIFDKIGAYTIKGLEIMIPEIDNKNSDNLIEDEFKISLGESSFWLKVNPAAINYKIRYRSMRKFGQKSALVTINGVPLDLWELDPVPIRDNTWLDYEFNIPVFLAFNKDSIKVEITPLNIDWTGFTYWMVSNGNITDSIDIGNIESENSHYFFSESTGLTGIMRGRYEIDATVVENNSNILRNTILEGYWNNEQSPSIQSSLGHFFALGDVDAPITNGICFGFNDKGLYNYLPMPFNQRGHLKLKNISDSLSINNIKIRIAYKTESNLNLGNLHSKHNFFSTFPGDSDIEILNTSGQGKIVGLVLNGIGPSTSWLEGDERVYIDKLKSPLIYGTGTEDMFNGGDYFVLGERDLPMGSLNLNYYNYFNMYRTFLPDPIYFRNGVIYNLQRGKTNNVTARYNSLIFYYASVNEPLYIQTDYFKISEDVDSIHYGYLHFGGYYFNRAGFYEGTYDNDPVNNKGYECIDSSTFLVDIPNENGGVILVRGLNYQRLNQSAEIYINGQYVGIWSTSGNNEFKNWREDLFMIPPAFTNGVSPIRIDIKPKSDNWSEMYYEIHTLPAAANTNTLITNSEPSRIKASLFPNPMSESTRIFIDDEFNHNYDVSILNSYGSLVRQYKNLTENSLTISKDELSSGLYILKLTKSDDNSLLTSLKMLVK